MIAATSIHISIGEVAASLVLVAIAAAVSLWRRAELERDLGIAVVRSFVQLTAVGYVIQAIFDSKSLWLVVLLLAVMVGIAPQTRLYRTFFLDELGHDYVRTARAKGMTERTVLFRHVLRNAMIPILTNIGLALPGIFVGSFLIEVFFSIPGLGREVILAVNRSDYPVIQALTVYLAMLTMLINLSVDILYKLVDPRVVLR